MSRDEFILWRDQLDEILEAQPTWHGTARWLKVIRKLPHAVTLERVMDIAQRSEAEMVDKGEQLFGMLKMKMNTAASSLCIDMHNDRNGWEAYRRISANYDPIAEGTDMALMDQLMSMAKKEYKNFEETWAASKRFKKLLIEYNMITTGNRFEERNENWVTWNLLDAKTKVRAEAVGIKGVKRTMPMVMAFLDELHLEAQSDLLHSKIVGKGDAMDVSVLAQTTQQDDHSAAADDQEYSVQEKLNWVLSCVQSGDLDALGKGGRWTVKLSLIHI